MKCLRVISYLVGLCIYGLYSTYGIMEPEYEYIEYEDVPTSDVSRTTISGDKPQEDIYEDTYEDLRIVDQPQSIIFRVLPIQTGISRIIDLSDVKGRMGLPSTDIILASLASNDLDRLLHQITSVRGIIPVQMQRVTTVGSEPLRYVVLNLSPSDFDRILSTMSTIGTQRMVSTDPEIRMYVGQMNIPSNLLLTSLSSADYDRFLNHLSTVRGDITPTTIHRIMTSYNLPVSPFLLANLQVSDLQRLMVSMPTTRTISLPIAHVRHHSDDSKISVKTGGFVTKTTSDKLSGAAKLNARFTHGGSVGLNIDGSYNKNASKTGIVGTATTAND